MSVKLLVIDPQNDFCKSDGALYVPGSEKDCSRLASFIKNNKEVIDSIHITLDSHPNFHIAHPMFWVNKKGENPPPYTMITYQSFSERKWMPADHALWQKTEDYILELETKGHYSLIVWPSHCLTATSGFCVYDDVMKAARDWELSKSGRNISFIIKTSNPFTEHYSAVQAEVPDKDDITTRTNFTFIDGLKSAEMIYIAGEALSHCVSNTIRDLVAYIPADRMTLITDCTSCVSGYENTRTLLISEFSTQGMKTAESTLRL